MVVVMVMAMVAVAIPSLLLIFVRRIRTVGDSRRSFLQKSKPSRKKPRSISRSQAQKHPPQHYVHCEDDHISSKPNTANKKRWKQQQEDYGTNVSVSLSLSAGQQAAAAAHRLVLVPRTKPLGNP
jgi:hypothetical protein